MKMKYQPNFGKDKNMKQDKRQSDYETNWFVIKQLMIKFVMHLCVHIIHISINNIP